MAARKKKANGGSNALVPFEAGDSALAEIDEEWLSEMQEFARQETATAGAGGGWPFISLKGGRFTLNDQTTDELPPLIVLGATKENTYYATDYDPSTPQSPSCFAIGMTAEGHAIPEGVMAPPEDLSGKENDRCETCWANAFKSAKTGSGKACGNRVKLALLPADDLDLEVLEKIEGARMRISVTSVNAKNVPNEFTLQGWMSWSNYTRRVAAKGLSVSAVVVELKQVPVPGTQYHYLLFRPMSRVSKEHWQVLKKRFIEDAVPQLIAEPARDSGGDDTPGKPGGETRRKKVTRKKSSGKKKEDKKAAAAPRKARASKKDHARF